MGGTALWEGEDACSFDKGLAALGVVRVEDLKDRRGACMEWEEFTRFMVEKAALFKEQVNSSQRLLPKW